MTQRIVSRGKIQRVRLPGSPDVSQALDDLRSAVPDLGFLSGARLIEGVQLTAGSTTAVLHGLNRPLKGWLVARTNTNAAAGYLYDEQDSHPDTNKFLYLRAEGYSPKINLVVF